MGQWLTFRVNLYIREQSRIALHMALNYRSRAKALKVGKTLATTGNPVQVVEVGHYGTYRVRKHYNWPEAPKVTVRWHNHTSRDDLVSNESKRAERERIPQHASKYDKMAWGRSRAEKLRIAAELRKQGIPTRNAESGADPAQRLEWLQYRHLVLDPEYLAEHPTPDEVTFYDEEGEPIQTVKVDLREEVPMYPRR